MSFENIFAFLAVAALEAIFCAKSTNLCNYARRHYDEHLCEVILNLDQLLRSSCRFKIFLFLALVAISQINE